MKFFGGLSKSAKRYLLLSLIFLFLVGGSFVFVGARFFITATRNQIEGVKYGEGKTEQNCVDEGLRRHVPSIDPTMQVARAGFVAGCLISSKPTEKFCKDVPAVNILDQSPIIGWAQTRCSEEGFSDGGCHQIFLQVTNYCEMLKKED